MMCGSISHHVTLHSYDQSVRHVEEMMKELREDINEREKVSVLLVCYYLLLLFFKVLIAGLGQIRDQRTQQCDHVSTQCNNLIDQLAEVSHALKVIWLH